MRYVFLSSLVLLFCCTLEENSAPSKEILVEPSDRKLETKFISIDLDSLRPIVFPKATTINVNYDHSLKKAKQYEAYPFQPVWDYLIKQYDLDTATAQVVFECKDGYLASNTLAELYQAGGGYLAFRDLEASEGEMWPTKIEEKFSPYYFVWKDIPKGDHQLVWPYGLVKLRLFKDDPYKSIYPSDAPHLAKAFKNYKKHCIKCHAINGIGGDMGAEFNSPNNITEYRSKKDIIAYITDPKSFNPDSKMYPIKSLTKAEKEGLVDYLAYIANHKISLPKDTK